LSQAYRHGSRAVQPGPFGGANRSPSDRASGRHATASMPLVVGFFDQTWLRQTCRRGGVRHVREGDSVVGALRPETAQL